MHGKSNESEVKVRRKCATVKGRTFTNVKEIKKFAKRCTKNKCKHYDECYENGVFLNFDCKKVSRRISSLYSLITAILTSVFVVAVFKFLNLSIFKSVALIIFGFVVLDIIFTSFEWIVSKLKENFLFAKLSLAEKKRDKLLEKEDKLKQKEGRIKNPYHDDIESAKVAIEALKKLANKFKNNGEKILNCVEKLEKIIDRISVDFNKYPEVAFVFEVQLPKFYNTLTTYLLLFELENEEQANLSISFENCISKFSKCVEQKYTKIL